MTDAASTTRRDTRTDADIQTAFKASHGKVHALLNPANVVVVGANDRPGNWAQRIWRNVNRYGFPGGKYPISPSRDMIWDVKCYRNYAALPEKPDHIVMMAPAKFVPDLLKEGAEAGARSATIITAGFGELPDVESQALAKRLKEVIQETGLAVSGPNCVGNISAAAKLMTNIEDRQARIAPGPIAVVGQSGGLLMKVKATLEERGIDSAYMVTTGNEAGLTTPEYIAYFARQPDIKVIIAYVEAIKDSKAFFAACRMARAARKPLVVLKVGTSDAGKEAAMAHTGSLAGSINSFDAVTGPLGVIRATSLDAMVEIVEVLVYGRMPKGSRIAAMTTSGGKRGLLVDGGSAAGVTFPELAPDTRAKLEKMLGAGSFVGNPLDAGFAAVANLDIYIACLTAMAEDSNTDLLMLEGEVFREPGADRRELNVHSVAEAAKTLDKPIIYYNLACSGMTAYGRELHRKWQNLPFTQSIDKAFVAVKAALAYASLPDEPPVFRSTSSSRARELLETTLAEASGSALDEIQSKKLLAAYGIPLPQEEIATSAEAAAKIAERIGFPVVAKIVSPDILHKSDMGGVILNVRSADDARKAFDTIIERAGKQPGSPKIEGVLIAEQVSGGLELIIGGLLDPEVGPVVLFGTGGVDLELIRDSAVAGAPLDETTAQATIAKTIAGRKIKGYRGSAPLNHDAAVKGMIDVANLMADADGRIQSVDVNPFLLDGKRGVALDGLIVLKR